jgi:Tetratricopeptide repeat
VILDDITYPVQLAGWWPASHTGTGGVLATTRRRDAALTGAGRALIDVDVYTPAESQAYLTDRLTAAGRARLLDARSGELAEALGHLPLALGHAAAYVIDQQITCAAYLARYVTGRDRLDDLLPARAARETIPAGQVAPIVRAAADALVAVWPDPDHTDPALAAALRASTTTLAPYAGDALWHPVLFRAGNSLLNAGLHTAAISHWQQVAADAARILGPSTPTPLTAQANLAESYWQAGRTADAITIGERVAADRARILGPEHPATAAVVNELQEWKHQLRRRLRAGRRKQ